MAVACRTPRVLWIAAAGPDAGVRDALTDHGYVLLHIDTTGVPTKRGLAALRGEAVVWVGADSADIARTAGAVGQWRDALPDAALLVLLPRLRPLHEVLLLEAGADAVAARGADSLVWLARLRRLLRRLPVLPPSVPRVGALQIDVDGCSVRMAGHALELGHTAVALMHELAGHRGAPAPRERLLRHLGPGAARARSRTLDMAISRLRVALRAQGINELKIESVRGYGYRLVPLMSRSGRVAA